MAIACSAVCGRRVEMAQSVTPRISMHCVTRSVPISPEPMTPMRTGRPSSARLARSRARPVRATLVMQGPSKAYCDRNSRKRGQRVNETAGPAPTPTLPQFGEHGLGLGEIGFRAGSEFGQIVVLEDDQRALAGGD